MSGENGIATEIVNISTSDDSTEHEFEPQFEPIITLPEVEVSLNEEHEEELVKLRAKLFRFDTTDVEQSQWKERGTGEVKILKHKENHSCRVVMRRDKTFKICANHFITPWMSLKPSFGSDRAWVWTVMADFADETAKTECLAIRFASATIASQWKEKFEEAQKIVTEQCDLYRNNPIGDSITDSGQSSESDPESPKQETEIKKDEQKEDKNVPSASSSLTDTLKETESTKEVTDKLANLDVTK